MRHTTVLLLLAALLLAGCGGDSDDAEETTTASQTSGELSITQFGAESEGGEREEILAAERAYFTALGDEDFDRACERLTQSSQDSIIQFANPELAKGGCAAILPRLLAKDAFKLARQAANGEVTAVRVEDDQAFVVYRAPGADLFVMPMVDEDGEWKASSLSGSILIPDLG